FSRQPRKKGLDFGAAQLGRMPHAMEVHERAHPVHIGLLCSDAVVQVADALAQLIEQPRRLQRRQRGTSAAHRVTINTVCLYSLPMRRQEHKPAANIPKDRGKAERIEQTRVVKKLSVTQPGALKLAQRYGEALVCVRYRHDAERRYRYTTIELVVERAPIKRRNPALDAIVVVRIPFGDTERQL